MNISWSDLPGFLMVLALPLWFALFPTKAVGFYRWFYTRSGIDQRRIDALTPRQFRIGGFVFLVIYVAIYVLGRK